MRTPLPFSQIPAAASAAFAGGRRRAALPRAFAARASAQRGFAPPAVSLSALAAGGALALLLPGPAAGLPLGAAAGSAAAAALLMSQPFAARRWPPRAAAASLAALIAACAALGAFAAAGGAGTLPFAAAGAVAAGAAARFAFGRGEAPANAEPALLPDREIAERVRQGKRGGERWLLIAGPPACGKSALAGQLKDAALADGDAHPQAPPRVSEERGGARVTELSLRDAGGGPRRVWLWETRSLDACGEDGGPPALREFDGFLFVADPLRSPDLAPTFPGDMVPGEPVDHGAMAQRLAEHGAGRGEPPPAWAVVSKSDLLRFSIAAPLLAFPLRPGPSWHEQMSSLPLDFADRTRRDLARLLGLDCLVRDYDPDFVWGAGSPYFAYSPPRAGARAPFPGMDLWISVRNAALRNGSGA